MVDFEHIRTKRYIREFCYDLSARGGDTNPESSAPYIPPTDASLDTDTQNFDDQFLAMEPKLVEEAANDDAPEPSTEWHRAFDAYNFRNDQILSVVDDVIASASAERCKSPDAVDALNVPLPESPATSTRSARSRELRSLTPSESSCSQHADSASTTSELAESAPTAAPSTALLERIETIAQDDNVKAARHSRDLVRPPKPSADEDWDILEGDPGSAYNGQREVGRGLIDRYRLAIIRRKESNVKRRASVLVRRSSATSSSTKTGDSERTGLAHPPSLATLRARLKGRAERRKDKRVPPVSGMRSAQEAKQ